MKFFKIASPIILIILFGLIFILNSCDSGIVEPIFGSVSGKITKQDYSSGTNAPLSGLKVYLISTDSKVDSIDYLKNKAAIVDSTVTDSDGNYVIKNIHAGNYIVMPEMGGSFLYSLKEKSDPYAFSIALGRRNHWVDFVASDKSMMDLEFWHFYLNIAHANLPPLSNPDRIRYYMKIKRLQWALFIPMVKDDETYERTFTAADALGNFCTLTYSYGYTSLAYTLGNTFLIELGTLDFDHYYEGPKNKWSVYVDLSLNIPQYVQIQILWDTRSYRRVK